MRALTHLPSAMVSCEATPTTAMSSSRRGVWRTYVPPLPGPDDLNQHLISRELRSAHADEKLRRRHAALTPRPGYEKLCVQSEQRRGHVRRRCSVGQVAAERCQVTNLQRPDYARTLRQACEAIAHLLSELERAGRNARADAKSAIAEALDHFQLG
jgi:hypothetical protein